MKKILAAVLVFIAAVFTGSDASAIVDVEGRYWFTDLGAEIKSSSGSVIGNDIDFVDDLGLDDNKGFFEGRITLELGSHKLRYGFIPMNWDGTNTITQPVTFGGQTFSASTTVTSEIDVKYHRLGYEYDIIDMLNNRLGIIFEVKYFDGDATLKSSSAEVTESASFPLPTIGIAGQLGLPFLFSVGGEITGITIGSQAYLVDAEASVNLKPMPFVIISGGYRYFSIHVNKDDDKADITLKGPFLTLRADF